MNPLHISQKAFNKAKGYFQDKVVWITGASSGIGEQLALQLVQLSAKLIISAQSEVDLNRVKQSMSGNKDNVHILPFDLECLDLIPGKVQDALSLYGRVDVLINNAGIGMRDFAMNTSLKVDRKIMDINYFAPIALTKGVLQQMLDRKCGHIVVISSMQGKYGVPRSAAYAASKHALHGFFSALRTEIDTGIVPITIIIPGIINTEITKRAMKGDGSLYGKQERTQAEGYPASKTATSIILAITAKKEEVFIGGSEGITLFIHWLSPKLMSRIIANHPIRAIRSLKEKLHLSKKQTVSNIPIP